MHEFSMMITVIIGIVLISIIIENITPSGKYKKYVKFAFGLVIMITVITSIFNMLSITYKLSTDGFIYEDFEIGTNNDTHYISAIKQEFTQKLNNEIEKSIINDMGFNCIVISEVDDELKNISLKVKCSAKQGILIKDFIIKKYNIKDIDITEEVNFSE